MKLNARQKYVVIFCWALFLISTIYVPSEINHKGTTMFQQFAFIWETDGEIALKILLTEWIAIVVTFFAFFVINGSE
jgi:hypothetical protein